MNSLTFFLAKFDNLSLILSLHNKVFHIKNLQIVVHTFGNIKILFFEFF
jgi:hypothetical protein